MCIRDNIGFVWRVVAVCFFIVAMVAAVVADDYYNIKSLTDDLTSINKQTSDAIINLKFDSDIITSNYPFNPNHQTVLNFTGNTLTGLTISGKPALTKISQSNTSGRLISIEDSPKNINFSNLHLSSFVLRNTIITPNTSRNGGAINITNDGNSDERVVTFDNMIFDQNEIDLTNTSNSSIVARGGGLYIDGGIMSDHSNKGESITLTETDFTNNSVKLDNAHYQNKSEVAGGAAAILHYDVAKFIGGDIVGNSVSANMKNGFVAGGGLYLSDVGDGSSIAKLNFKNNSATMLIGGVGDVYGGALFAEQEYNVGTSSLTMPKTTLNISESNFTNNHTKNEGIESAFGGAVALVRNLDGVFDKVIFDKNSVTAKSNDAAGGAIAIHSLYKDSDLLTDDDKININNQMTKFTDTIFTNNKAIVKTSTSASAKGGAIFSTQLIKTAKTDFINNSSEGASAFGGAIAITQTPNGSYDSSGISIIQGGTFTGNKSIANGGSSNKSLGGAIYTSKNLEVVSSLAFGDVLFRDNVATSRAANAAYGNSIFASAGVIFNAEVGSKIEDFDGHYIVGNVTKTGGGTLSLLGETQHKAGSYFIREGVLRSGFTRDGESGFRAIKNLDGSSSAGVVEFDAGTIWELDLTNANMKKLINGVTIADDKIIGADEALRIEHSLIDIELVGGTIKLARVLDVANLSDIYASAAYLHKWNTIQKAANTRINQLLYRHGAIRGNYISDNSQVEHRGQSYGVPAVLAGDGRNFYNAWVNYVGRKSAMNSSYNAYNGQLLKTVSNGIQFGFDLSSAYGSHLGFMFGYEDSRGDLVNDSIRGDDYYVGAYGAMLFSYGFDMRGMFGLGHQRYRISRYDFRFNQDFFVKPDGNTFEANLEFGRRFQTLHNMAIRPFIALDYLTNSVSAANEGVGGFRYEDLSLNQLFIRLGTDIQCHFNLFCFDAGVAFSQQVSDDHAEATVSQGPISTSLKTSRYGHSVFTFNVGMSYAFDRYRACSVYINYVGDIFVGGEKESINSLQTGIQYRF
ncbi:MAG: autotransporter domain-containing protein [Planctomycetaceae bacterium]|jgi:hypothetical protein|nr:autotransporter domain-containing protein [Planctomycetaceae bacterium]